jgi:hypothetical protein
MFLAHDREPSVTYENGDIVPTMRGWGAPQTTNNLKTAS